MTGIDVRRRGRFNTEHPWLLAATVLLITVLLTVGGGPIEFGGRTTIIFISGLICLLVGIWSGAYRQLAAVSWPAKILLAVIVVLPLAQLVPLPPDIWGALPGRALEESVFAQVGVDQSWHPLSSAPLDTALTVLMLFPLAAIVVAGLALSENENRLLAFAIIGLVVAGVLVGVVQLVSAGQALRFYRTAHHGHLIGFFANKNHMALLLAMAMPLGGLLLTSRSESPRAGMAGVVAWVAALYACEIATGSRAGLVLGMISAVTCILIFLPVRAQTGRWIGLGAVAGIGLIIVTFSSTRIFERLLTRFQDVESDARWNIWATSLQAIREYLPFGSGLGSFRDVYNKYESIDVLSPQYANAMHQDYGQFLLEAGLVAPVILVFVLVVLVGRLLRARVPTRGRGRGATDRWAWVAGLIVALALLHSLVDYPLRRPAIAAMFGLSIAWLMRTDGRRGPREGVHSGQA